MVGVLLKKLVNLFHESLKSTPLNKHSLKSILVISLKRMAFILLLGFTVLLIETCAYGILFLVKHLS